MSILADVDFCFNPLFYEVPTYTIRYINTPQKIPVLILYSTRFLLILNKPAGEGNESECFNPLFYEVPTYTAKAEGRLVVLPWF